MRHGRRKDRNRVLWLVKFLKEWCGREELIERRRGICRALEKKVLTQDMRFFMTEALAKTDIPWNLQHELIGRTRKFLSKKDKALAQELSKSDVELYEKAGKSYKKKDYKKCLQFLEKINVKSGHVYYAVGLTHSALKDFKGAEKYYLMAIDKGNDGAMNNLANLYIDENQPEKAEKDYLMAIDKGNGNAMYNLANLYKDQNQTKKAEEYYLMAIGKGDLRAMYNLANLYRDQKQSEKAEKYYLMAIGKGDLRAMYNLANLYRDQKQSEKAEKYYLMAIGKGHLSAMNNLANLYVDQNQTKKAEEYYLMAIGKGDVSAMYNLAYLYKDQSNPKRLRNITSWL